MSKPEPVPPTPAELARYLKIRRHALAEELVEQPDFVWQVGSELAAAISKRDHLKEHSRKVEAELSVAARKELEKATEKAVSSWVQQHEKYERSRVLLIEASQKVREWEALQSAVSSRGIAIAKLCDMDDGHRTAVSTEHRRGSRKRGDLG